MATVLNMKEMQSRRGVKSWLARYPLPSFFLIAYGFSWSMMLPPLLGKNGLGLLDYTPPNGLVQLLAIVFSFGPMIAAIILSAATGSGVRALFRSYRQVRAGLGIYLATLIGPPLAVMLGAFLVKGVGAFEIFEDGGWMSLPYYLLFIAIFLPIGGPLGEEAGWRGFALPRLQQRYGAALASLILGVLWAGWHLLNFFIPEAGTWTGSIPLYLIMIVSLSFLHTWVYNRTRGSLFIVTLFHAAIDAAAKLLLPMIFETQRAAGNLAVVSGMVVWVILVIVLTRGRLGYVGAKAEQ